MPIACSQEEAVVEKAFAEDSKVNVARNFVKTKVTAEKEAEDEEAEAENH